MAFVNSCKVAHSRMESMNYRGSNMCLKTTKLSYASSSMSITTALTDLGANFFILSPNKRISPSSNTQPNYDKTLTSSNRNSMGLPLILSKSLRGLKTLLNKYLGRARDYQSLPP